MLTTSGPVNYKIALRCSCCNLPFGYLMIEENRYILVIESLHHKDTHVNKIPLVMLPMEQPVIPDKIQ